MTTSRMLINITRNMAAVDKFYQQLTTGKKIQFPSEGPIIASRALKFRANVAETESFLSNVKQGTSWMEITEKAMGNITEALTSIKELCAQGASDNFNIDNKQTFAEQIRGLLAQMETEVNVTYTGRYVFSGYRTDKPPTLTADQPGSDYSITQYLSSGDVEKARLWTRDEATLEVSVSETYRLKLPYTGVTDLTELRLLDAAGNPAGVIPLETLPTAKGDPRAYNPAGDKAYYIEDTGEIILGEDARNAVYANADGSIRLDYRKTGLKAGELNPEIYFDCADNVSGKTYRAANQDIYYEFGVNTRVPINTKAETALSAAAYGELRSMLAVVDGVVPSTEAELREYFAAQGYVGDGLTEKIKERQTAERQQFSGVLHDAFSNMLGIVEKRSSQVSKEYTRLGSGMNRLSLIQNRLEQDALSYESLMSENEDVDMLQATMDLNAANYVYQMALKAGGSISQTSLADFIR
jgi:flagellar hook-associated protein 3 FlgL